MEGWPHILGEPGGILNIWASSKICAVLGLWLNVTELCSNVTWKDFHPPGMGNCSWNVKLLLTQPGWTWGTAETDGAKMTLQPQNSSPGTTSVYLWGGRKGWMEDYFSWRFQSLSPKICAELILVYWNSSNSAALRFWEVAPCWLKSEVKKLLVVFLKIFNCVLGFTCWGCCCYLFIYLNRFCTALTRVWGNDRLHFSSSQLQICWTKRLKICFSCFRNPKGPPDSE